MNRFFHSFFDENPMAQFVRGNINHMMASQQQQQQQHQPQNDRRGAPPASERAIRQLPTVIVSPEDLVDPSNRECCICFEENHLHDRVTRLPCAHIYHHACIVDWLRKHCTCPICRYELDTDNVEYERSRAERMRNYRPRYAEYELHRMTVRQLRELSRHVGQSTSDTGMIVEKSDLIRGLVEGGRIDVIAAPAPVEYPLSLLRCMKVGELKRCMEDAGVFFDPKLVVEKADMVEIFINSGRLVVLPEAVAAEDVPEATSEASAAVADTSNVYNRDDNDAKEKAKKRPSSRNGSRTRVPVVTTVESDDDEQSQPFLSADDHRNARMLMTEVQVPDREPVSHEHEADFSEDGSLHESDQEDDFIEDTTDQELDALERPCSPMDLGCPVSETDAENELASAEMGVDDYDGDLEFEIPRLAGRHASKVPSVSSESARADEYSSVSDAHSPFRERTIAELRALARELRVDVSDCIERPEIIARILASSGDDADEEASYVPRPEHFDQWSVSELRALATEVNVDLSRCVVRSEMVQEIIDASDARPHMANYLGALAPLARLTVPQLRAVAREWQVNVSDCLEKGEIIHRLVTSAGEAVN